MEHIVTTMKTTSCIMILTIVLTLIGSTLGLNIDLPDFTKMDLVSSSKPDNDGIKIFVDRWAGEWAHNINKQDAKAMADTYTEDAIYHEEGRAMSSNKAEIRQDYKEWFNLGAKKGLVWVGGYGPIGDNAIFVWGKYTVGNEDASLPSEKGKFVSIMKQVNDGHKTDVDYKIYRDFVFH